MKQVFSHANSTLTVLFWKIGHRINDEVLKNKRAEYAKQIVSILSTQLKRQYEKNFEIRNLRRMEIGLQPVFLYSSLHIF
ncbi:DUF1016 family protein [Chitinophaga sp. Mgbs1]|uniref:DUF1016 family protein n=1 Tax=Chitinophaga solisilvae TaxID=1233460 RepID=A0A433WQ95_9BACT|nr:DUF1016 family protein [Chitinophaga solisilvae]